MPTLVCESVHFLSAGDETMFFNWLNTIECIKEIKGVGTELQLNIKETVISDDNLRDLIAIFTRYNINHKQLSQFKTSSNTHWFYNNKKAFWHNHVFS